MELELAAVALVATAEEIEDALASAVEGEYFSWGVTLLPSDCRQRSCPLAAAMAMLILIIREKPKLTTRESSLGHEESIIVSYVT